MYLKEPNLKHEPYRLTDTERKMLFKRVVTPNGTGTLINITHTSAEVEIAGEKDYYPKEKIMLSATQYSGSPIEMPSEYQDIWHQACLKEAADTRIKRDFIAGRMTLNDYMIHEKQVYGTINA